MLAKGMATQQLVCRDDWRTSDVTKQVAVLAALGIPFSTERVWRERQGDERITFLHGQRSVHPHRAGLPGCKALVKLYRTGELQRTDVHHPMLDGLRAIANFLALRQWIKEGQTHVLGQCCPDRALLKPGPVIVNAAIPVCRTANIHRAAALALLGFDVETITEPQEGKPVFTVLNAGNFSSVLTAVELITEHKRDPRAMMLSANPAHQAFAFAVECARTYLKLLQHIADECTMLMFSARKGPEHAFVLDMATDKAKRRADRFIAGIE